MGKDEYGEFFYGFDGTRGRKLRCVFMLLCAFMCFFFYGAFMRRVAMANCKTRN